MLNKAIQLLKGKEYTYLFYLIVRRFKKTFVGTEYKKNVGFFNSADITKFLESSTKLEEKNNVDSDFYKRKAIIYKRLGNSKKATNTMGKSLKLFSKEEASDLISNVEIKIFGKDKVSTEYVYLGGRDNLGVFIHTDLENIQKQYITLLTDQYSGNIFNAKREVLFNDIIVEEVNLLKKITPRMISHINYKKIRFLSFEKKGNVLNASDSGNNLDLEIDKVIRLNNIIKKSISYDDFYNILKDNGLSSDLKTLINIKEKKTLEKDFSKITSMINNEIITNETLAIIDKMKKLITEFKLYDKINYLEYYEFSHGDFKQQNMTLDDQTGKYYVIDWDTYGFRLKGYDMAKFLVRCSFTFETIKKEILPKISALEKNKNITEILFIYQFIIESITFPNVNKESEHNITVAFDYFKKTINNYKD